jgi:hypothetical protein
VLPPHGRIRRAANCSGRLVRSSRSVACWCWPTDYWVSYSYDGGLTFPNEQHIAGPFDQLTAPYARGFFLGDYEGLQPSGNGFLAVFVKTNCDALDATGQTFPNGGACAPANSTATATSNTNPTDVFATTLSP